jgi:hypothetical protein
VNKIRLQTLQNFLEASFFALIIHFEGKSVSKIIILCNDVNGLLLSQSFKQTIGKTGEGAS